MNQRRLSEKTMNQRLWVVALLLPLGVGFGCSSKRAVEEDVAPDLSNTPDSSTMSEGFDRARAAFIEHTATQVSRDVADIRIMPNSAAEVDIWDLPNRAPGMNPGVGGAWAFEAKAFDPVTRFIRGWARADGLVITHEQNLGRFFEEAGLWSESPSLSFEELAPRLVWSLGPPHMSSDLPPTLQMNPDGSGRATVTSDMVVPNMSPTQATFVITFNADHTATMVRE